MDLDVVDLFLENSFVPIYGITLVVAMVNYPKYFDTTLKYYPILLLYTFLNELLGDLIYKYDSFSLAFNNLYADNYMVIYNIYNVIFFLYFIYLFRSYIKSTVYRTIIKYAGLLFLIVSFVNPFFQNFFLEYQRMVFFVGAVVLIATIAVFLTESGKSQKRISRKNNILIWMGFGLLVYHIGYFPIKVLRFKNELEGLVDGPSMRRIHLLLVLFMYTCFIIGFVRMRGSLSKKLD